MKHLLKSNKHMIKKVDNQQHRLYARRLKKSPIHLHVTTSTQGSRKRSGQRNFSFLYLLSSSGANTISGIEEPHPHLGKLGISPMSTNDDPLLQGDNTMPPSAQPKAVHMDYLIFLRERAISNEEIGNRAAHIRKSTEYTQEIRDKVQAYIEQHGLSKEVSSLTTEAGPIPILGITCTPRVVDGISTLGEIDAVTRDFPMEIVR